MRRIRASRLVAVVVAFVMTVTTLAVVATAPARATTQGWVINDLVAIEAIGNFEWFNRSVAVGGGLYVHPNYTACGAVGFTAYDGSGRQVAREVRPKDGQYYCSPGRHGFGFTLDASNVSGGIQWIKVQLWVKWPDPKPAGEKYYYRP